MAYLKKSEFAKACGISPSMVTKSIKKGDLVTTKDGQKISTTKEPNKTFYREHLAALEAAEKEKAALEKKGKKPGEKKEDPQKAQDKKEEKTKDQEKAQQEFEFNHELNRGKAELDYKIKQARLETMELDLKKQKAELLPIQLVQDIFETYTDTSLTIFKDELEAMRLNLVSKHRLKPQEAADLQATFINYLNQANDKAINEALGKMKKAIEATRQRFGVKEETTKK